jgi:transposase
MPAISVRTDLSAAALRAAAGEERDGRVVRRLLALANVLDGHDRDAAARMAGMQRQTLRDWVHRYNAHGVEGLRNRHGGGAKSKLSEGEQAALVGLVLAGPDPTRDDTRVWRLKDLCRVVEERFGVAYADSGMFDLLTRLGVSWMTARPQHPSSDPKAQAALKKTSRRRSPPSPPRTPRPSGSRSGSSTRAASGRRGG